MRITSIAAALLVVSAVGQAQPIPLASLDPKNLDISVVMYQGRSATRIADHDGMGGVALLKGSAFKSGTIEVDLAGKPLQVAFEGARGFVGVAFHVQANGKNETIYLRPTNGRANDMLRRNHSTQYVSEPEWPWNRLRDESPGVYESYVDLETGAWTKYKIIVKGTRAELYVNGASQPCLIVNDMKLGDVGGAIGFMSGPGSETFFANLKVTPN